MPSPYPRILVTGGAGFIGSRFIAALLERRDDVAVTNLDKLTYAGNPANNASVADDPRYTFVHGDICDHHLVGELMPGHDAVVHCAAESHVDRSIADAEPFTLTNVVGTQVLLEEAVRHGLRRFHQVSTDEVFGDLPLDRPDLRFSEDSPYAPNSPYAASKAAADHLVRAYHHTHALDVVITHGSNNFGPHQHPEKVIPRFITNLLQGRKVPLYGDGRNVRDWVHVDDHADAMLAALERGQPGRSYNVGGGNERSNLELTRELLRLTGCGEDMIDRVPDRKGHDRRYALDTARIRSELGWRPTRSAWPDALEATVRWYEQNRDWWQAARRRT